MWLNKEPDALEHEYIVLETEDITDRETRFFILHRWPGDSPSDNPDETLTNNDSEPRGSSPYKLFSNLMPSRSVSPISSMEEGLLTPASSSTLSPPVSFPVQKHSLTDTMSLTATKALSKNKGNDETPAMDLLLGRKHIYERRFSGRNARQIKPKNMTLYELMILAQTVHKFAPFYSLLEKNCYWYCNIIFDACLELFHEDDSFRAGDNERIAKFDKYDSSISGRWNGWLVSVTNVEDLAVIVRDYKVAHTEAFNMVIFFFL